MSWDIQLTRSSLPACVPQSTRFSVVTSCFLLACSFISHVLLANHHRDQGAGKLRLGSHWLDWALNNRIECLWVNSCLRGHLAGFMSIDAVVAVARVLRVMRVSDLLCGRPTSCESRCCWWLRFWKLSFVRLLLCLVRTPAHALVLWLMRRFDTAP